VQKQIYIFHSRFNLPATANAQQAWAVFHLIFTAKKTNNSHSLTPMGCTISRRQMVEAVVAYHTVKVLERDVNDEARQ
jgi:hypothetical protein